MEKERNTKLISIFSMVLAVLCLSIGFAAFSRTLNIESSATVEVSDENFDIDLSKDPDDVVTEDIGEATPSPSPDGPTYNKEEVTVNNDEDGNAVIKGLNATFTKPGQSVTYSNIYAVNTGAFDAYLTGLEIANAAGGENAVLCTAREGTNYVTDACKGIKITVEVKDELETSTYSTLTATVEGKQNGVIGADATLAAPKQGEKSAHKVIVKLEYLEGSAIADGPFDVVFGNVTVSYSSQKGN